MNKKILVSLSVIAAVAAVVVGATTAYFSDTETSTGNTFTAGAIDLKIDNTSYVTDENGVLVDSPSNTWVLSDLDQQLFFSFADLKPGDVGEDTISLHVNNNDAWACMSIALTATPEHDVTEPEGEVDFTAGEREGELQNELYFAFWADDGDNVYESDEVIFAQGLAATLFDGQRWALADASRNVWTNNAGDPLQGGNDNEPVYYVGKVWCYGTLTESAAPEGDTNPVDRGTTGFTCNGASVSNASQTDGISADVEFYAEQYRNNPNFLCYVPQGYCGDGNLGAGEECDDGNNVDGDGCSANCALEQCSRVTLFSDVFSCANPLSAGWTGEYAESGESEYLQYDIYSEIGAGSYDGHYMVTEDDAAAIRSVNTTGTTGIVLSYFRRTKDAESTDRLVAEWRVGNSGPWTEIERTSSFTTWAQNTYNFPSSADNQSEIQIRLWMDDGEGDHARWDNVLVTGVECVVPG